MRSADGRSTLVHLINGAGHFGNTFHDPPRLAGLGVELPCVVRPGDVQRLRDAGSCEHSKAARSSWNWASWTRSRLCRSNPDPIGAI